jgi:hypothetical protein
MLSTIESQEAVTASCCVGVVVTLAAFDHERATASDCILAKVAAAFRLATSHRNVNRDEQGIGHVDHETLNCLHRRIAGLDRLADCRRRSVDRP